MAPSIAVQQDDRHHRDFRLVGIEMVQALELRRYHMQMQREASR